MLNPLVHIYPIHKGSQWAVLNATHKTDVSIVGVRVLQHVGFRLSEKWIPVRLH